MEDLIKEISDRTGITVEQSKNAVLLLADKMKAKFPKAMHDEIDAVLNGGDFGDAFKNKMKDAGHKAEDIAKTFAKKADEMFSDVSDKMKDFFQNKKN